MLCDIKHNWVGGMASPIVVMGVSGSGKSTVGAALAQRLRVPFADADDFHPPANIAKMAAGQALDDDDRYPWLEAIGEWLAQHCGDGGVMSCSALRRKYRDQLRRHCPDVEFLHLAGTPEVIGKRQAGGRDISCPRPCWHLSSPRSSRSSPMKAASSSMSIRTSIPSSTTTSRYPPRAQPNRRTDDHGNHHSGGQ
jgi:hypothetical protein